MESNCNHRPYNCISSSLLAWLTLFLRVSLAAWKIKKQVFKAYFTLIFLPKRDKILRTFGLIAQWIEHPPSKRVVAGSNPAQSVVFNIVDSVLRGYEASR